MGDRALEPAREHLYGAQDAAQYLGVHRSTLHLAIRQGVIVPDERTPGGHVRFSRETLNELRKRLAFSSVTGGEIALAPLRAQSSIAHLLAAPQTYNLHDIGEEVVRQVRDVLPDIDACSLVQYLPGAHRHSPLRLLAQAGFPDEVTAAFMRAKEDRNLVVVQALHALKPQICEDIAQRPMNTWLMWLTRIWRLGAYAALPIVVDNQPRGVLIVVSHLPRHFSRQDMLFLQGMADLLSVAFEVTRENANNAAVPHTTPAMKLMWLAANLRAGACTEQHSHGQHGQEHVLSNRVSPLVGAFLRFSGAQNVYALGFDLAIPTDDLRIGGLACGACAEENVGLILKETWETNGTVYTALASGIPLETGASSHSERPASLAGIRRGAIVALWKGYPPGPWVEDLLVTFACAYLLAIS